VEVAIGVLSRVWYRKGSVAQGDSNEVEQVDRSVAGYVARARRNRRRRNCDVPCLHSTEHEGKRCAERNGRLCSHTASFLGV
jgi:hypothetical protein